MRALVLAAAVLALAVQETVAQQPGPHHPRAGMTRMADHMGMMDSLNARLDTLVNRMNRASANRKVSAMADVINEMVAQRRAMQEHMRQMMQSHQGMMMPGMGAPGPGKGRGPAPLGKDSAAADTSHSAHHPPD